MTEITGPGTGTPSPAGSSKTKLFTGEKNNLALKTHISVPLYAVIATELTCLQKQISTN